MRNYLQLVPMLLVVLLLFGGGLLLGLAQSFSYFPLIGLDRPGLDAYAKLLASREFGQSLLLTLWVGGTSTVLSTVLGVGCALLLRGLARGGGPATFAFQLTLPVPHAVGAVAMLFLLGQSGLLARLAYALGLIGQPAEFPALVYDRWGAGIIAEYLWKEIPFIGIIALASLRGVSRDYEQAAATLGASPWQRFRYVTLPLLAPSLLPASILVFAYGFGSFEVPYLLGATYPATLPVLAYRAYTNVDLQKRPEAMAISMVITLIIGALVWAYMWAVRRAVRE
jgi:putative spermidine/putrescine transport system permease protein